MSKIGKLLRSETKLSDIWSYIQGNVRYKLYYSKYFSWMIRKLIRKQIYFRIKAMNRQCYNQGSCVLCGCETTKLQMADKGCLGACYPPIMNKDQWKRFISGKKVVDKKERMWTYEEDGTTGKKSVHLYAIDGTLINIANV